MAIKSVVIGSDHGALRLKDQIVTHLSGLGYKVEDCGVFTEDSVDYPDTSRTVCEAFLDGSYEFGIVLCGTGIGAAIAANKTAGIRCALVHDTFTAEMARAHNDANVIAMGGRIMYHEPVELILDAYLKATFLGQRHARRVEKLNRLDTLG
jgi:ribose 5-phosphate isomerase B